MTSVTYGMRKSLCIANKMGVQEQQQNCMEAESLTKAYNTQNDRVSGLSELQENVSESDVSVLRRGEARRGRHLLC
jgi:hypothetical protein